MVAQSLLMVVGLGLGLGLAYMVVVLVRGGGVSWFYNFLASVSVLGVGAGLLVGFMATYGLVTKLVTSLGTIGSSFILLFAWLFPQTLAPIVGSALGIVVGFVSIVPRIAEAATAAVMLAGALVVFELTRRGDIFVWAIVAAPLWLTAASMLVGNGLAPLQQRD
jgi:hypothetical protein